MTVSNELQRRWQVNLAESREDQFKVAHFSQNVVHTRYHFGEPWPVTNLKFELKLEAKTQGYRF